MLDCLSGDNTNKGISITKPLGKYVIYGTSKNLDGESKNYFALAKNWWHVDKVSPIKLYEENRSLSGFNLHNFLFNQMFNSRRFILDVFSKLFNFYRDGLIKPIIDSVHSFDDVSEGLLLRVLKIRVIEVFVVVVVKVSTALSRLQERKNIGKVILEPYFEQGNMASSVSFLSEGFVISVVV